MPDCSGLFLWRYCIPAGAAHGDPNTNCCAINLLDQSYRFNTSTLLWPNGVAPWCHIYPSWFVWACVLSCKRVDNVTIFSMNGASYRNDTARRIMFYNAIKSGNVTRNVVNRLSLRHAPAWHHPSVNITEPPEFSLIDDLVCLPLEELYFEDVYLRPEYEGFTVVPDRRGLNGTTFDM
ncbi:hypothetical protein VOLCADRAFT_95846 [Volvox carteri f. nagariensis]|uniref:Uncharacterized protein n=1 Tax=Volvox carteri f. nagariensis TaxID=3068 RepID=D8U8J0_VOLCA|nr:uncharacterized protein VOLCADRAFT_95846 [Volvox carteri f. nagariensis]EFJ43931.1 hypothetical protein VOLCADRAFT_95846 [Volvox carteri f. nagariensis]|eukprot:XP_002954943.1 hypothetical protein VOLCADRAFT_95846 [Volvox carteri f. nagariensis]